MLIVVAAICVSSQHHALAFAPPNSRLSVHIPHSLFKEEGYDHRLTMFGVPQLGGSLFQNVYYTPDDLCSPIVDTRKGFPERDIERDGQTMKPWQTPYILMVDPGGCSLVQKVRNAQHAGAAGVVIADNTCMCGDAECTAQTNGSCKNKEPIMADDGSGSDISIPSFWMFKAGADSVKAELKYNRPVTIEMSWSLPSPDDRVEYDIFSSPTDPFSRTFMEQFEPIAQALGDRAYFTPHMYIHDGVRSHCGNEAENFCYNLCTNNGRYCALPPDNMNGRVSGADVVRESLRRMCIWNQYGAEDGVGLVWWNYIREFMARCSGDYFFIEDCVNDAYRHSKVNAALIERCMHDSGGLEKDYANAFLDIEIGMQEQQGVVVVPTVLVNGVALHASKMSVSSIFQAICDAASITDTPDICKRCSRSEDPVACVKNRDGGTKIMSWFSNNAKLFGLVLLIMGCGVVRIARNKRLQRM